METKLIHDHPGLMTWRTPKGILQVLDSKHGEELFNINFKGIHNCATMLRLLDGSGFTPKLIQENNYSILMEDLGGSEGVIDWTPDDWQNLRRALVKILITFRQKGIRHGDLNGNNIIIKDKKPYIIDFQETHYLDQPPPQRLPIPDTYWIYSTIINWINDANYSDPYRVLRRWALIYNDLNDNKYRLDFPWKNKGLLDMGCFQGDFSALAAAEYFKVVGIDPGGFRSGENSIQIALNLWSDIPNLSFGQFDIAEWGNFKYDVILFMDTFPYVVGAHGKEKAIELLNQMVRESKRVYFEVQMWGDQSGVEWLKTEEDIFNLCPNARFTKLGNTPIGNIERTLWRLEK